MEGVLYNDAPYLKRWFSDIKHCNKGFSQGIRLIWVRLYEIPLQIWSEHFLKWISKEIGNFVGVNSSSSNKPKLDFSKIHIITESLELINKILRFKVGNNKYRILAFKETGGFSSFINNRFSIVHSSSPSLSEKNDRESVDHISNNMQLLPTQSGYLDSSPVINNTSGVTNHFEGISYAPYS